MEERGRYDLVVVNDRLESAAGRIIRALAD
jgi:hypothetical protein